MPFNARSYSDEKITQLKKLIRIQMHFGCRNQKAICEFIYFANRVLRLRNAVEMFYFSVCEYLIHKSNFLGMRPECICAFSRKIFTYAEQEKIRFGIV